MKIGWESGGLKPLWVKSVNLMFYYIVHEPKAIIGWSLFFLLNLLYSPTVSSVGCHLLLDIICYYVLIEMKECVLLAL